MRPTKPDRRTHHPGLRKRAVAAAVVLAVMMIAVPVAAEGGWDSSLDRVRSGFNSRQWWDNHDDANATTILMRGCNRDDGANHRMRVQLKRARFGPDVKYVEKNFDRCDREGRVGNWGERGVRGNYYATFNHLNFGRASATTVNARY